MIRVSLSQAVRKGTISFSTDGAQRLLNTSYHSRRQLIQKSLPTLSSSTSSSSSSSVAAISTAARQADGESTSDANGGRKILSGMAVAASAAMAALYINSSHTACEDPVSSSADKTPKTALDYLNFEVWTPVLADREDLAELVDEHDDEMAGYPVFTSEQVAENDGTDGKPIWMSYGGVSRIVVECMSELTDGF